MDDNTKTQNNPIGGSLGGQYGGGNDASPDLFNPADRRRMNDPESDLNPLRIDDQNSGFDDEDEDADLTGSATEDDANYAKLGDEDDILPPDTAHREISDDRDNRIIQDPTMDEDPADDPAEDPYAPVR